MWYINIILLPLACIQKFRVTVFSENLKCWIETRHKWAWFAPNRTCSIDELYELFICLHANLCVSQPEYIDIYIYVYNSLHTNISAYMKGGFERMHIFNIYVHIYWYIRLIQKIINVCMYVCINTPHTSCLCSFWLIWPNAVEFRAGQTC